MYKIIDDQTDFVVVDKTAGTSFHSESGEAGLFESFKQQQALKELYPVHRLDKMTSGLLVFAKNKITAQELGKLFENQQVEKYYLAISDKKPKKKQGLIKGDMTAARRGSYKLLPSTKNPAITQFFSHSIGEGRRLYLLKPSTGKTHQLRVSMKSIAAPILGDVRYYPGCPVLERGYLHAYQIGFSLMGKAYYYQVAPSDGTGFLSEAVKGCLAAQWLTPSELNWPTI